MSIKTQHVLEFTVVTDNAEAASAAFAIIQRGSDPYQLGLSHAALPMPEGGNPSHRRTAFKATTEGNREELEAYFHRVADALALLGCEVIG